MVGTLNSPLSGSESWSFMKKSCMHYIILLSVHWLKGRKSPNTGYTIWRGKDKSLYFSF